MLNLNIMHDVQYKGVVRFAFPLHNETHA